MDRALILELFPVFFGTKHLTVAVFGGGEDARRKVRLLSKTHAQIYVVHDQPEPDFENEFLERVTFVPASAADWVLDEVGFVIIALSGEEGLNAALELARSRNLRVNVVDRPDLCDFTVPSILDRGSVVAAVATGGAAPILARDLRARLETLLPKRIGDLAEFARSFRGAVAAKFETGEGRRGFWERMLRGPIAEKVLAGDETGARTDMLRALESDERGKGVVHIVGAGPGDPELLTLKALRVLQDADIVFFDRLVGEGVLDLIRRDADRVSVGKTKGFHSVPQDQINELLVTEALKGRRVVRLKGGDPFVFGRGGEELDALRHAGVDAHVIPGISSALGCAAEAGVPLTHRDHAQSVTFVTGHAKAGGVPDLDWPSLARANQTVVVYMGVGTAGVISEKLIAAGRDGDVPVAVIENGTRENEIRVFGRLKELPQLITDNEIKGPALLIIGEVAGLTPEAIAALTKEMESAA